MKVYGDINGKPVHEYIISNGENLQVNIITYGAIVTNIFTPDTEGNVGDVVIGFENLEGYLQKKNPFMNAIIGRYANRIGNATFSLNDKTYTLQANERTSCLHGGINGFDKRIWDVINYNDHSITLKLISPDGEEGFPGDVAVEVTYEVTKENALIIKYNATTDADTPINLTSHCYFNLSAGVDDSILGHTIQVLGDNITEVNEMQSPTGEIVPVANTRYDLNAAKLLKKCEDGFDHNWVLNNTEGQPQATLFHPASGRCMEMHTTEPGLQVYTAKYLDGSLKNTKKGRMYNQYGAICLEAQHFADSPNIAHFPNTILKPGEVYTQTTLYKFSVKS
jgi:aldose 1-epimerase